MKTLFSLMILVAASTSFARIPDVRCSANDRTADQIKLSIHYTITMDSCDDEIGPVELDCQQNPDTHDMDNASVERLSQAMVQGCITREEIPVTIRTEQGRMIKTIAKLSRSLAVECANVELPKVENDLSCGDSRHPFIPVQMGNPRIRDTEVN